MKLLLICLQEQSHATSTSQFVTQQFQKIGKKSSQWQPIFATSGWRKECTAILAVPQIFYVAVVTPFVQYYFGIQLLYMLPILYNYVTHSEMKQQVCNTDLFLRCYIGVHQQKNSRCQFGCYQANFIFGHTTI